MVETSTTGNAKVGGFFASLVLFGLVGGLTNISLLIIFIVCSSLGYRLVRDTGDSKYTERNITRASDCPQDYPQANQELAKNTEK